MIEYKLEYKLNMFEAAKLSYPHFYYLKPKLEETIDKFVKENNLINPTKYHIIETARTSPDVVIIILFRSRPKTEAELFVEQMEFMLQISF